MERHIHRAINVCIMRRRRNTSGFLIPVLLTGLLLSGPSSNLRAQPSDPAIEVDDTVEVVVALATVQVRRTVLARLPRGRTLRVLHLKNDWLWTEVKIDNVAIEGWVHASNVRKVDPTPPAPRPQPATPDAPSQPSIVDRLQRMGATTRLGPKHILEGVDFRGNPVPKGFFARMAGLDQIVTLSLAFCDSTSDAQLADLATLTRLRELDLMFCPNITDEGLTHLGKLTSLRSLNLAGTNITDTGLTALAALPHLDTLNISAGFDGEGGITDDGLTAIARMTSLTALDLSGNPITDDGLARLETLRDLERLNLGDTLVSDEGLRRLSKLPKLRSLDLAFCRTVTEKGLAHLADCPQLRDLNVTFLQLSDTGLAHLSEFQSLESLTVADTGISEAEFRLLQAALPECRIIGFEQPPEGSLEDREWRMEDGN